ncbi:DUF1127 domain-containing protein [Roseomonas haemaphysalidis]|jgi:uncharacterized protein YjiS (DUF1127 family)|uniref:DUF1127 domain-containing protein n=1 Tax=Roseomonas haemaphysalidis TaxID=2768162 RepID=A0ABS3KUI7_9PROT|nr:DUF1127 domain-containing protein [Roseomonas haemaphysalidis]MBO1081150.1 DUF1127 domain-containing protein [Roseomonas haemaphysalidis]
MSAQLGNALPLSRTTQNPVQSSAWAVLLRRVLTVVVTRQHLLELDHHMLRDIGMTPQQARREAGRAPWDIEADGKPRR